MSIEYTEMFVETHFLFFFFSISTFLTNNQILIVGLEEVPEEASFLEELALEVGASYLEELALEVEASYLEEPFLVEEDLSLASFLEELDLEEAFLAFLALVEAFLVAFLAFLALVDRQQGVLEFLFLVVALIEGLVLPLLALDHQVQ